MRRRDEDDEIYGMLELRAVVRAQAEREVALRAAQTEERLWNSLGYALVSLIGLAVAVLLGIVGAALMCSFAAVAAVGGGLLFTFTRRSHDETRTPPAMTPR
ncbi:hypothetical protein GTY64_18965 [Streptomyces sp. SID8376]|uniref:hypothetical protein n=1 Tax=unclassified Streptomyces TaxID=2593676 RepID=UPI00037D2EFE|nr:hypothetical protein [Streptomyces sp. SID8376]